MEIGDTTELHEPFQEYDSFESLLIHLNSLRNTHEHIASIEGLGKEIEEVHLQRYSHLAHLEIGWARLMWESHHEDILHGIP